MSTQQPEALRLAARLRAGYSNLRGDLEPAAAELERLHSQVQKLETERETNDKVLRSSVPDRWKGCTSPAGSVQSYIAELEEQQKREPLTEVEINELYDQNYSHDQPAGQYFIEIIRMAEEAHGITQSITSIEETDK